MTRELCECAVRNHSSAIEYVPCGLLTLELARLAVQDDPATIKFLPSSMKQTLLGELEHAQKSAY